MAASPIAYFDTHKLIDAIVMIILTSLIILSQKIRERARIGHIYLCENEHRVHEVFFGT